MSPFIPGWHVQLVPCLYSIYVAYSQFHIFCFCYFLWLQTENRRVPQWHERWERVGVQPIIHTDCRVHSASLCPALYCTYTVYVDFATRLNGIAIIQRQFSFLFTMHYWVYYVHYIQVTGTQDISIDLSTNVNNKNKQQK